MRCRIRIKGHLDLSWQEWLEGLELVHDVTGTTVLRGTLRDQAALYGVLLKIHRLNVRLLSLDTIEALQDEFPFYWTVRMEGKEHIMATSDLEKLIEDWALAWSSPNTQEKLVSLFTDDCVYEDLPLGVLTHGKTELEQFYHMTRGAFPDFKIALTSHFVAGNRAGAEWVMTGTHQGDLPGLPATNKQVSIRGASAFELQNNKVRRCSDYFDMATALRQLGFLSAS
jgi:steroid delta-isomerase-like uncharacterized protein